MFKKAAKTHFLVEKKNQKMLIFPMMPVKKLQIALSNPFSHFANLVYPLYNQIIKKIEKF